MNQSASGQTDLVKRFRSFREWRMWTHDHQFFFSPDYRAQLIARVQANGIADPLTDVVTSPDKILISHGNYRETIKAGRLISRHRGLLLELKHLASKNLAHLLTSQCKAYAPEALTDFALFLRGRYPRFVGSEYAETDADRQSLYPIPCENLTSLSFKTGVFDLVLSNDVFEHVPDLDKSLTEIARVLNGRGVLISTFPFAVNRETGIIKAKLVGDQISYLTEPEFHGNPMNPADGSLVFEVPGWDLVDRAQAAGFADAYFSLISSARYGVVGKDAGGVFVFVATKQIIVE